MSPTPATIHGKYVDVFKKKIYPALITIENGRISAITRVDSAPDRWIMPGFIDAHIHIESSMLLPAEFAKMAVIHGTVATVSDPHEIANVCGIQGIDFMIENGSQSPFKFYFGAPSCVPATDFETSGAVIPAAEIDRLMSRDEIKYLSEMMNFPGVLSSDPEVMAKIAAARAAEKPVDGHAPGLTGALAAQYANAGITTDHECFTMAEAVDKLSAGMYIIIREGSAAKNFEALADLLATHPGKLMFCSDDKHPDALVHGHINELVKRAVKKGYNLFEILHAACVLPVLHYNLDVGLLRTGDPADLIVVGDLRDFPVLQTYINGELVAENGKSLLTTSPPAVINNFQCKERQSDAFELTTDKPVSEVRVLVIDALDGQLITGVSESVLPVTDQKIMSDINQDVIKIGVLNRYQPADPVAIGFVRNFGLKKGAIASSVAHDSHNIVFAGVDDESICAAVNAVIGHQGGISVSDGAQTQSMALPVAGLMTTLDAWDTAAQYEKMDAAAKALGASLSAPFMTLSFMALPVIPSLKITDKGLFDVDVFEFADLFYN